MYCRSSCFCGSSHTGGVVRRSRVQRYDRSSIAHNYFALARYLSQSFLHVLDENPTFSFLLHDILTFTAECSLRSQCQNPRNTLTITATILKTPGPHKKCHARHMVFPSEAGTVLYGSQKNRFLSDTENQSDNHS